MEEIIWSDGSSPVRSQKSDRPENKMEQTNIKNIEQQTTPVMSTKREDANNKISERDMLGQVCQNPFLSESNYVDDLDVQQNFLIPRSSHE